MKNLISILILFISFISYSQDIMHLKSGFDVEVKVHEIGKKEIKYKKYNNLDGPLYTANIKDIKSITFKNGEVESFKGDKSKNSFEILPNAISVNYGELMVGRIGLAYTRIFDSKKIGIKIPISLNYMNNSYNFNYGANIQFFSGLDLNFYPFEQRKLTYYTGIGLRVGMLMNQYYYPYYDYYYNPQYVWIPIVVQDRLFIGGYVNNGLTLNLTPHFSISAMVGVGMRDIEGYAWAEPSAVGELNMSIRF